MKQMHVIVDLQFGSCGKGLLAGYLAEKVVKPDVVVTAWAPNAGHTYINSEGRKFVNIALPNGIVSPNLRYILIGPGSVINPDQLAKELIEYRDILTGRNVKLMIHPHAAIVRQDHRDAEAAGMVGIGSTMKGVGAAMIEKIQRHTAARIIAKSDTPELDSWSGFVCTPEEYARVLDMAETVLVEGAQGYSLGINSGFYPYTTSRECTVPQILSDCAIPFGKARDQWRNLVVVHGAARTFPIRVANRFDDKGVQIGWSGPCYPDQKEIDWSEIGIEPELTTVTKLPRRVFTFSFKQIKEAVRANGVDSIFLNFLNYLPSDEARHAFVREVERETGVRVRWLGMGPTANDVIEDQNWE